jgi:hypothetical protein
MKRILLMKRRHAFLLLLLFVPCLIPLFICSPSIFANEVENAVSLRLGMPSDVFLNLGLVGEYDVYQYGIAVELDYDRQIQDWLLLGSLLGYGFGEAESGRPFDYQHYISAAGSIGFGSLDGFSGSLILGIVYMPMKDPLLMPDLGFKLAWKYFSLGVSTGSLSFGGRLVY